MEWRPIETAPRDGTPVLLGGGRDCEAEYARSDAEVTLARAPARAMWNGTLWVMCWNEAGYCLVAYENPTHWMPLPAPLPAPE